MSEIVNQRPAKVFDILATATPSEAEKMLEEYTGGDYYLVAVVPWFGGARVFLRRHAQASVAKSTHEALDAVVLRMYRREPHVSVEAVRRALQELGIKKGTDAVRDALTRARSVAAREGDERARGYDISYIHSTH